MESNNNISELLNEVAPLTGLEAVLEEPEGDSWIAVVSEEACFVIDLHAEQRRLIFSAPIGAFPAQGGEGLLASMLSFNHKVAANHGIWLSLDAPGGMVAQSLDIAVEGLTVVKLQSAIEAFVAAVESWRARLAAPPEEPIVGRFGQARAAGSKQILWQGAMKV